MVLKYSSRRIMRHFPLTFTVKGLSHSTERDYVVHMKNLYFWLLISKPFYQCSNYEL
eukprot:12086.XXX_101402_101572_1 [CDS] Oithona nana genome sequencing.